jgi:DNA invertase Pin-like site-specific DNA recombinase/transcription initiation factor TFIIIB Brf1 subunit/transcription initiation factor TFIIB
LKAIIAEAEYRTPDRTKKDLKIMRYAGYVRISSEEQVGNYSIEAQSRAIRTWVQAQGGQLIKIYSDEAQSGRSSDRPGFVQMRQDARKHQFDALVVHKFDRFARNRTDALAIKSLLRYDYSVKVFSVSEPSEDSDGPIGALIEGIMESVAEWYSRNLATEIAKGRREAHAQGFHLNKAPFGYRKQQKHLVVHPEEAAAVRFAFELYATGNCSFNDVAQQLNQRGYKGTSGRSFSKDAIRAILTNLLYVGKVRYQETLYNADGTRRYTAPIEWQDGQHPPIITPELWDACQQSAGKRGFHRQGTEKYRPYLLRGLVYCQHCVSTTTAEVNFRARGKMYAHTQRERYSYYQYSSPHQGFDCPESAALTADIDAQTVEILSQLKPPTEWRKKILSTISTILGEKSLEERLTEIHNTIERMDFRWDSGFITDKHDYLEKRLRLQQELERLTPADDDLEKAVDLLENFKERYEACGDNVEAQADLIKLIVERVYIQGRRVSAITLKADYHVVLGQDGETPHFIELDPCIHDWPRRDFSPYLVHRLNLRPAGFFNSFIPMIHPLTPRRKGNTPAPSVIKQFGSVTMPENVWLIWQMNTV